MSHQEIEVDLATRIDNPAWEYIRQVPHDDLFGRGGFTPTMFRIDDEPSLPVEDRFKNFRDRATGMWTWAIPSPESLGYILSILDGRSVVELGAGSGYWAWMLRQCGVDVAAYDIAPIGHEKSWYRERDSIPGFEPMEYYPVAEGSIEVLEEVDNHHRVLFLCWPSYDSPFAYEAVKAFKGDTVIYVGEGSGGCNADWRFFSLMEGEDHRWSDDNQSEPAPEQEWEEIGFGPMTQWSGIHDQLIVYRRK